MTDKEFGKWYRSHIQDMIEAGIMHPESEAGRWVKIALIAANSQYSPILDQMQQRINALEALIHGDKVKIEPKVKSIEPKVKPKPPVKEQRAAATKTNKTAAPINKVKRKPVTKGWSV